MATEKGPAVPSSFQVPSLWEGVIRVHAPLHSKVSMAIQLDGQTRAKDVIARFQYENRYTHTSQQYDNRYTHTQQYDDRYTHTQQYDNRYTHTTI